MNLFLDKINILLICVAILNSVLGSLILINGYKKKINVIYSFNILAIIFWIIAMILYRWSPQETAVLWCTILYVTPTFIASSFLYFTYIFPTENKNELYYKKVIIYGINLLMVALVIWPGFIIEDVNLAPGSEKEIIFSKNYIIYVLYTLSFFLFGFYRLFKKYLISRGLEKMQIIYLSASYTVAANIAFLTNLIMPWMGHFFLNWVGQVATGIMVLFTGYAIVKHHLMNIKVITAELFSILLVLIALFEIFLSKSLSELLIRVFILLITVIFIILLIRSILKEIIRREQMEKLTKELKKTTRDLASANKELKRLDDAKSEFLSIASHQLRTPLTIIKGYTSMMLEGSFGKISKQVKESLGKALVFGLF